MSNETNGRAAVDEAALEVDPEALQAAEFYGAQAMLEALIGKTIVGVATKNDRTSISTADGITLVFCGFLGTEPTLG